MTTLTEPMPETVAAVAALSGLRASYPLLATVAETEAWGGRSTPRPRTPMSEAAKERTDEQLREERADRLYADRRGIRQSGNTHAPIRPALLDAELLAESTVVDQAWIAASALRQAETWLASPRPYRGVLTFEAAATYLEVAIWDIQPATASTAAVELAGADRAVRSATGLADIRVPIPGNPTCLACGRRGLRIDVTPADDRAWTVACRPDCICWGTQCGCRRRGRTLGQAHLWTAAQAGLTLGTLRTLRRLDDSRRRARSQPAGAGQESTGRSSVIVVDGIEWMTAAAAIVHLGPDIRPDRLRDWHRRGLVDTYRVGHRAYYRLDQLLDAERNTRASGKRPRGVVDEQVCERATM